MAFASKDLSLLGGFRNLCSDIGCWRRRLAHEARLDLLGTETGYSRKAQSRTLPEGFVFLVGQAPHHRDHRLFRAPGQATVRTTFEEIFRREGVVPAIVEGDAFHRYDRENMQEKMIEMQRQGYANFSHFGPEANLFEELEALFREYGEHGAGRCAAICTTRRTLGPHGLKAGMFTPVGGPSRRERRSCFTKACMAR